MAYILVPFLKNGLLIKLLALLTRFCFWLVYNEKMFYSHLKLNCFGKKLVCFKLYIGNKSKISYVLLNVETVFSYNILMTKIFNKKKTYVSCRLFNTHKKKWLTERQFTRVINRCLKVFFFDKTVKNVFSVWRKKTRVSDYLVCTTNWSRK